MMLPAHEHKYFLFETKSTFEPLPPQLKIDGESAKLGVKIEPQPDLYQRIEYAITACNCGHVKKVKVEQPDENPS